MSTKRSAASRGSLSPDDKSRKRQRPPPTKSHIPSQASTDVPATVKNQVKDSQGNRCWLCNQKAHRKNRPLQIAHVFPQAIGKRPFFVEHHKSSGTLLSNIHDAANLIPLCKICHSAFDRKEWRFLPEEMSAWLRDARADPKKDYIQHWNTRRDIKFHRWRLLPVPGSKASRDDHFLSAFTDYPVKEWAGEVGAVILTNTGLCGLRTKGLDEGLAKGLEEYDELRKMWISYESPCSAEGCTICSPKPKRAEDKLDKVNGRADRNDSNEGDAHDHQDQDGKDKNEEEGDRHWKEEGEEGDGGDNHGGHYEKRRLIARGNRLRSGQIPSRAFPKPHGYRRRKLVYGSHLFRAMRRDRTKVSMPHHIIRKSSRSKRPKKSALYDESVPYSHRKGYTWANTTANELMARWQNLPYIKHNDGRITITGGRETSDTPFLYP